MTVTDTVAAGEVVVLEHTQIAGLSAFEEVLEARSGTVPWRRVDVPSGALLPGNVAALGGLVVMGGTMSAVDPHAHPWMPAEVALLARAVDVGVPVLGICLGAQLLGTAMGGQVTRRAVPEVGYLPLHRTPEASTDELIAAWPDGAAALLLHEDEVSTLPPDAAVLLDGSDGTAAWRIGDAWAIQFHPEVTPEQLASWAHDGHLTDLLARTEADVEALLAEATRRGRFTVPQGRALIGRFLDGPVRNRLAG